MSERLLRDAAVTAKVGLSRSQITRLEEQGNFPRRRKIGARAVAWLESEIDQWILERHIALVGSGKQIEGCPKARRAS